MRFDGRGDVEWQLARMLNGGLDLEDNLRGTLLDVEIGGPETEIPHDLGYVPTGFLLIMKEGPGDVWSARVKAWTEHSIFIGSDVKSLKVRLFVL